MKYLESYYEIESIELRYIAEQLQENDLNSLWVRCTLFR